MVFFCILDFLTRTLRVTIKTKNKMQKIILLLFIVGITVSCAPEQKTEMTHEVVLNSIGYDTSVDGTKMPLYGGSMSTIELVENYVKAHNDRDLEAIRNINAVENFKVWDATGQVIEGSDAHIAFLTEWFAQTNPQWKGNYVIANEYTDKEGQLQQWVTSGYDLTFTEGGTEVKVNKVLDALIVNGKIQMFYVNQRIMTPNE